MAARICPRCREINSEDAAMCWACYRALPCANAPSPPPAWMNPLYRKNEKLLWRIWKAFNRPWRPNLKSVAQKPAPEVIAREAWQDMKICAQCDSRNTLAAMTCWMCESPLDEKPLDKARVCPRCGKANPVEADMCALCYTSFVGVATYEPPVGEIKCPQCGEINLQVGRCRSCSYDLQQPAPFFLTPLTIFGFTSLALSGWLPQPINWLLLAVGSYIVVRWIIEGRRRFVQQFKLEAIPSPEAEEEPIVRIAGTILDYAIRDGATRIALEKQQKGVQVRYEINGQWCEQMRVPAYVWVPLREHFVARANAIQTVGRGRGEGCYQGKFIRNGNAPPHDVQLVYEWLPPQPRERLTLELA